MKTDSTAVLSADGVYRYSLQRRWDAGPLLCYIMLNPSTADAAKDDSTIRRCVGLAKANGFSAITVVNLFALRSTKPQALTGVPFDVAIGDHNDRHICEAFLSADAIVAAWGKQGGKLGRWVGARVSPIRAIAKSASKTVGYLAHCADGSPRHPLYLPGNTTIKHPPPEVPDAR